MDADTRKKQATLQHGLRVLQMGLCAASMRRLPCPARFMHLTRQLPSATDLRIRNINSQAQQMPLQQRQTALQHRNSERATQRTAWQTSSGGMPSCSYPPATAAGHTLHWRSAARTIYTRSKCHASTLNSRLYHAAVPVYTNQAWQVAWRRLQDTWHTSQLGWGAWEAMYRSSSVYLPTIPGMRAAYLDLLSALNLAGAGGKVLATLALTAVEMSRSTSRVAAEGFAMTLPRHLAAKSTDLSSSSADTTAVIVATVMAAIEMLANVTRALYIALIFAPVLLTAPLALHWNIYRGEWMELVRRTLEAGGPAFIKWGQWAATRHDIFPPDLCSELELLHSQAPAHAFRHTKRAISESFGMPHTELFDYIDTEPIASGSIGQIHRARLSYKGAALTGFEHGQLVAVKVRHPGVADTILRDFSTMLSVAHLLSYLPSTAHLRLEDTLKQFAAPLKEQVDLAREASNLQRFNYNFRQTQAVQFPVPLYPLVSSEVLVETYEEGDHISRYIAQGDESSINAKLSIIGSGTMLQMMLMDNLIHSDLHPGNILVRLTPPNGLLGALYNGLDKLKRSTLVTKSTRARLDNLQQRWLQPQMVLLDVGMATELSDEDQINMVGLFKSFAAMDGKACGHWALQFSGNEQRCPNPEAFQNDMERTFAELRRMEEGATWQDVAYTNSAEMLAHVLELVRLHYVTLPGHICAVVVTTMVLEGWSNKLDPTHSVLTQVQKMFAATNIPWRARLEKTVDHVMSEEPDQQAMIDP